MELTKDDLGKFFYIIEYDIRGYIEILRCKLVKIIFTNKHELEDKDTIISNLITDVILKFEDDYYSPNVKDVYKTLEEVVKAVKIIENENNKV